VQSDLAFGHSFVIYYQKIACEEELSINYQGNSLIRKAKRQTELFFFNCQFSEQS
jgi:hypothetical protein